MNSYLCVLDCRVVVAQGLVWSRVRSPLYTHRMVTFDGMFNSMVTTDPTFSTLVIPEDSSPMGIKSVLERMAADNGYDRGNITIKVSDVHDWPKGWTAPGHVSGTPISSSRTSSSMSPRARP